MVLTYLTSCRGLYCCGSAHVSALLIYAVTLPPVSHSSCWPFSQVRKGSLVHVTGRLRIDKYQDHYQNLQISVVIMAEEVSARAREH